MRNRTINSLDRCGLRSVLLILFLLSTEAVIGACGVRSGDRLLLVNTRPVGCSTSSERLAEGIHAAEFVEGRWNTTPFDSLVGSLDPTIPTIVYVHGNQIDNADACRRGRDVYHRLIRCATDERSVQFVVFSWCSSKVKGILRDYRLKAALTRPVGWQLAWVLDRLPNGSKVGLLGYSYGARVTSGAAHLLAGGSLSGLNYPRDGERVSGAAPMRAVFLAAAYDAPWNGCRGYHRHSLDRLDSLLTTVNPRDPAMRYYKLVPIGSKPPAMGGTGPLGLTSEHAARVQVMNVTRSVGRTHDLYDYLSVPGLMQQTWCRLTFVDTVEEAIPTTIETADAAVVEDLVVQH